jgi:glutaredoxin 3
LTATVTMYRTRFCGYCMLAKRLLEKRGIPYSEIDVSGDAEKRAWLREVTGSHTVPQLFIGEQSIGGYVELHRLDRSGELNRLISSAARPGG